MTDSQSLPITKWLDQLVDGDTAAQQKLWDACAQKVAECARRRLRSADRRQSDEDDVALSVMNSLFQRLSDGRLDRPGNRRQMWSLLKKITKYKAVTQIRRQVAEKRGGGRVLGESALRRATSDQDAFAAIPHAIPDPAEALAEAEAFTAMINRLEDDELRQIALMKIARYTNAEIAERLNVTKRTVERKLNTIRQQIVGS